MVGFRYCKSAIQHLYLLFTEPNRFCIEVDVFESVVLDVDEGIDCFGQEIEELVFTVVSFGE